MRALGWLQTPRSVAGGLPPPPPARDRRRSRFASCDESRLARYPSAGPKRRVLAKGDIRWWCIPGWRTCESSLDRLGSRETEGGGISGLGPGPARSDLGLADERMSTALRIPRPRSPDGSNLFLRRPVVRSICSHFCSLTHLIQSLLPFVVALVDLPRIAYLVNLG